MIPLTFIGGLVLGLACALVGGLVVFVVLYVRMGRPPHGGGSSDVPIPSPDDSYHGYRESWSPYWPAREEVNQN